MSPGPQFAHFWYRWLVEVMLVEVAVQEMVVVEVVVIGVVVEVVGRGGGGRCGW